MKNYTEIYTYNPFDNAVSDKKTWINNDKILAIKQNKVSVNYCKNGVEVTEIELPNKIYTIKGWINSLDDLNMNGGDVS